ncbi:MAG: EamA/RhaT family transporter [Gammaproteobacteria bacterium]|nr:MAG: EamA/RhaT family transporter [Gammaproteobacteria bacterium]RLA24379.1 MAG: EamA/RhaT family transporter [Gammaproteobacteria bacterium]
MLTLLTALLMSIVAATIKQLVATVAVEMILLVQYLTCAALMLPWLAKNGFKALKTEHMGLHLARAVSGWLCLYAYFLAIEHIPLVDAVLLRNAAPLCVPVWVLLWLKISIPLVRWIPVMVGFVGIALVLQPTSDGFKLWHLLGLGSAIAMAGSIVTTRLLALTEPTSRIMFHYFFLSALFTVPLALSKEILIPLSALPFMIGIGLFTFFSMWCYTRAYQYASATIISPISYFGVVFTGLWGWLLWDQIPDNIALIGALLVILGGIGSVLMGKVGAAK